MKAAEAKRTSTAGHLQKKMNGPFFNKGRERSFFSKFNEGPGYFFNAAPIQSKLNIGAPNDVYEKEADSMADKVVQRLSDPSSVQTKSSLIGSATPFVQKKCAHCEEEEKLQKKEKEDDTLLNGKLQKKSIFESNAEPPDDGSLSLRKDEGAAVQRKCAECEKEEKLQKKSDGLQIASSNIESRLSSSKGSGSPLPVATREQMESSFGADFSNVRIHNDSSSVQMSKDLNAQAFTYGSDIYFNSGKYDANVKGGKHLLAHELTHVMQQRSANEKVQRDLAIEPSDPLARQQELTFKQIHDAIIYNNDRYGQKSIQLIQDVVGAIVTGTMDEDTINLVALYQAENELTADGMVGPNTFNQITSELEAEGASDETCLNMFLVGVRTPMELHAAASPNTANIFGHFDVEVRFSPHCDCSKFEYRQFISGNVTLNGVNINNQFSVPPVNVLPASGSFVEDGNTTLANNGRYGHRNLQANQGMFNQYTDSAGNIDMTNGCIFHSFDEPGVTGGPANSGDTYVFDFRFFGDIRKNGKMIERKFWSVRERVVIP